MCGFLVVAALEGQSVSEESLKRGSLALAHRGPDDEQIIVRSNIGIAFRRLSINDLSTGTQPLWNENNSCSLVCNGEIYNSPDLKSKLESSGHKFKTGSDCEAILPLYQSDPSDFVSKLEGMFALVIADFDKQRITFARDRFGIKPLYIYKDSSWFILASEIKALLATGLIAKEANSRYFYDSFTFGFALDQQTYIKGINAVAPASIGVLDIGSKKPPLTRKYWKPEFPERKGLSEILTGAKAQKEIKELLGKSVKSHLLSDVPVAAYLSGGLDSTITSLLMKQLTDKDLTTFSIGFEDPEFDETTIFEKTNKFANFNGIRLSTSNSDIKLFSETIRTIEMPQFSPMDIPLAKLSARVREEGIKVVICGEGSDELLGGYTVFPWMQIAATLNLPAARPLRDTLVPAALNFLQIHPKTHHVFTDVFSDESAAIEKELGFFPPWLPIWRRKASRCSALFAEPEKIFINGHPALQALSETIRKDYPKIDRFDAGLFVELATRLPNFILQRTDRTSMKNSVEARVPYLDRAFAEATLRCPPVVKTFGFKEKSVLRKAFKDILPPHFKSIRKFGYSAPNQWCWEADGKDLIDQHLSTEALNRIGFFNVKEVESRISLVKQAAQQKKWTLEAQEDAAFLTGIISMQVLLS